MAKRFSCESSKACREKGIHHCTFAVESGEDEELVKEVQRHLREEHDVRLDRSRVLQEAS